MYFAICPNCTDKVLRKYRVTILLRLIITIQKSAYVKNAKKV